MLYVDSDLYWPSCGSYNAWSKIGLLHQAVMFQCRNTGHAVLKSANPEIHKTKQCFCSSLLRRLPLPSCRILLFSQRKQLQPRPFYCVVCCCWCQIWVCLFSISIRKKRETEICLWDTLGLAAVMRCSWHLNQACGGTENRSVLPCGAGSTWASREACSRGHPFLCCVLLVKTFIAQYLCTYVYKYIYIYTFVCMCF